MYSLYFSGIIKMGKSIQKIDKKSENRRWAIASSKFMNLVREINFNRKVKFPDALREFHKVTFSQDKRTVRFSLPKFRPWSGLNGLQSILF